MFDILESRKEFLQSYKIPHKKTKLTPEDLTVYVCYQLLEATRKKQSQKKWRWTTILQNSNESDWSCHLCGKKISCIDDITLDHIEPRNGKKRGGGDLCLAHPACNVLRSNVPIKMWRMCQLFEHNYKIFYKKALREESRIQAIEKEYRRLNT